MNLYYSVPLSRLVDSAGNPLQAVPRLAYGDILPVVFTALDADNTPVDLSAATRWKLTVAVDREDAAKPVLEVLDITYDPAAKTLSFTIDSKTPEFFMAVNGKSQVVLLAGLCGYDADDAPLFPFAWDMTGAMPCGGGGVPEFVDNSIAIHNKSEDAHVALFAAKVDKETGKGLSANDYSDEEKEKLAGLSNYDDTELRGELATKATQAEIATAVNTHDDAEDAHAALFAAKVDKEEGKSLLADAEITRLAGVDNYDDTELKAEVAAKATPADIAAAVETHDDAEDAHTELFAAKVDKEEGKSLLADTEITRLAGVDNYDDTELKAEVAAKATPADIAAAVETHDDAEDAHEALFAAKVDTEEGKSLLADTEIIRLAGLSNYDDTALRTDVTALETGKADLVDGVLAATQVPPNVVQAVSAIEGVQQVGIFPCEQAVSSPLHGAVTDFNQMRTQGNYWIPYAANATNFPIRGAGHLQVFTSSTNYLLQIYTLYDSGELFTRSYRAGAWDPWIRYAQTSQFIRPGEDAQWEWIPVGPTRNYKTLAEVYAYMRTKSMSKNKGFDLVLDAGTYAANIMFYRCHVRIRSADAANPALLDAGTSFLYFSTNSYVDLADLVINGRVIIETGSYGYFSRLTVNAGTNDRGVSCQLGAYMVLNDSVINQTGTVRTGTGVFISEAAGARVNRTDISGFATGILSQQGSYVLCLSTSGNTITNCATGARAQESSHITINSDVYTFVNCTTECSPAANTSGNYNSFIRRA